MGVHSKEAYGAIRILLDIPPEEPIFILRGQDKLARATLDHYDSLASTAGCSPEFLYDLLQARNEFNHFSIAFSEKMKRPD